MKLDKLFLCHKGLSLVWNFRRLEVNVEEADLASLDFFELGSSEPVAPRISYAVDHVRMLVPWSRRARHVNALIKTVPEIHSLSTTMMLFRVWCLVTWRVDVNVSHKHTISIFKAELTKLESGGLI
jgi:hypothetical protein